MNTNADDAPYWGFHLSIDAGGADLTKISDPQLIERFIKDLVKRIDMVAYGEPQIVRFGSGNKEGITAQQLIETSNLAAHFVDRDNTMYLDVFSCKPYDTDIVIGLVKQYFKPERVRPNYLTRQA